MVTIPNTPANEHLEGTNDADTFALITGAGTNPIPGDNNGHDTYDGKDGHDRILGGWSYDVLHVTNHLANLVSIEELDGGDTTLGRNTILATAVADTLDFSDYVIKNFVIDGGKGNDVITGSLDSANQFRGGEGNDTLTGGNEDDIFYLITGGDTNGLDQHDGGAGYNKIVGGWSIDTLHVRNNLSNLANIQELDGGDTTLGRNVILAQSGVHDTLDFSDFTIRNFDIDGRDGDDKITGSADDNRIIGNTGSDTLDGRGGSDTYLVGVGHGVDTFNDTGPAGDTDRIVATANNVKIGVLAIAGIEEISSGGKAGVDVVGSASAHQTLDFSNVTLTGIGVVDALNGNDTIHTSNISAGQAYRGGAGNDTFQLGTVNTVLRVSSADSGFDLFHGNNGATHRIVAENANTAIGIGRDYGGSDSVDIIDGNGKANVTIVGSNSSHDAWDLSGTQLIGISEVQTGNGNDTVHTSNFAPAGQAYRGGTGNDTFYLGDVDTVLRVSGTGDGYDSFTGNTADALHRLVAETNGTVIGLSGNYVNGVDIIDASGKTGVTVVAANGQHNTWNLSGTQLKSITHVELGNGTDTVQTALSTNTTGGQITYDGGVGTDRLVISLTAAQATNPGLIAQIAALTPGALNGTLTAGGMNLVARNFENFDIAVQAGDEFVIVDADNILVGTGGADSNLFVQSHPNGAGGVTNQPWIVLGLGSNDVMAGSNGNDILIGGSGSNTMSGLGGDDVFLVGDNSSNSGSFDGGSGHDRIVATADGAFIGLVAQNALTNIEEISGGGFANVKVGGTGSTAAPDTLVFTNVEIDGIAEIDAGSGNDVILTSNLSAASYRGGAHDDTFHLGFGHATLLYSGTSNGADTFLGNTEFGFHTILAGAANTTIGLAGGFANGVDKIDGGGFANVRVIGTSQADTLDFTGVEITGISGINGGSFNDTIIVSSSIDLESQIILDGGAHTDTLVLKLTAAQLADDDLQDQIDALVNGNGTVDASGFNFQAVNFENVVIDLLVV